MFTCCAVDTLDQNICDRVVVSSQTGQHVVLVHASLLQWIHDTIMEVKYNKIIQCMMVLYLFLSVSHVPLLNISFFAKEIKSPPHGELNWGQLTHSSYLLQKFYYNKEVTRTLLSFNNFSVKLCSYELNILSLWYHYGSSAQLTCAWLFSRDHYYHYRSL